MKTCSRCKKDKPLSEFQKASNTKDGYRDWCKWCMYEYKQKYNKHKGNRNSLIGIERASGEAKKQAKLDMKNDYYTSSIYVDEEIKIRRYTAIPPIIIFTDKL